MLNRSTSERCFIVNFDAACSGMSRSDSFSGDTLNNWTAEMTSTYAAIAAAVMVLVGGVFQPSDRSVVTGPILEGAAGERLDRHLTQQTDHGFSGVVLVAGSGTVLLHKGYGTADRRRATPIGVETIFDIGSITKQFTAAAILKLEVEG